MNQQAAQSPGSTVPASQPGEPDVAPSALPSIDAERLDALQRGLLQWYARHRRDLPWRRTRDPYAILVAEMMLQQTQAPRVEPRFRAWLARFPTLASLAAASTADVLREWSGLGYNSRAVRLQAIARQVVASGRGELPSSSDALRALPGIGAYTANAIACFAFGHELAVVDTNVNRVLYRVLLGPEPPGAPVPPRLAWALAARALPPKRAYDWNQALMDFGSAVCTARRPDCPSCVLRPCCRAAPTIHATLAARQTARGAGRSRAVPFATTSRYYRGQILRALGRLGPGDRLPIAALGPAIKGDYTAADRGWLEGLVGDLAREGLVTLSAGGGREPGTGYAPTPPVGPGARAAIGEARAPYHAAGEEQRREAGHDNHAEFVSLPEG